MNAHRIAAFTAAFVALVLVGACTPGAEDLAYPDLSAPPTVATPVSILTPAERDAAISELNAEAAANANIVK